MRAVLEATPEAVVDAIADVGNALDALPADTDLYETCAALSALTRSVDQMLVLLGLIEGDA